MKRCDIRILGARLAAAMVGAGLMAGSRDAAAALVPDESPTQPGEWGFRPANGSQPSRNPPAFVWRPQKGAVSYELELTAGAGVTSAPIRFAGLPWAAFCPPAALPLGKWSWRFRFFTKNETSAWSSARGFHVDRAAVAFPMPPVEEVLSRLPKEHPRLFVRPEHLAPLRAAAAGPRAADFATLTQRCERLLRKPPPSAEPPKYPADIVRESDEWMTIWWGNREYTIALLDGAATLAFVWRLGGPPLYGQTARQWLMAAAEWDPLGSTGYRYNDEAGMPYAYYFSRTYTFVHPLLDDRDRQRCREVMRVRGDEMYRHLCPRQLWRPYESHANRAWHFLGEVALAFHDEIPDARDWLKFVLHKQFCTYPVWSDEDGGWHEGLAYWTSYLHRFTWWADAIRTAAGIDVFRLPYFARAGYYPLYLAPPGAPAMGLGDLCDQPPGRYVGQLVGAFAAITRNPHWQWYAERTGDDAASRTARLSSSVGPYIEFVRGVRPTVESRPPTNLPSSILFRGIGQAYLNTDLLHSSNNVAVLFKSSPMGSYSHGYDAQNSFALYAFGRTLLIPTGRRDQYGSAHHRDWMWETKSVNSVTLNGGQGQLKRSLAAKGRVLAFHTSPTLDYVAGEAAEAYDGRLQTFERHLVFAKPDLLLVYDRLAAPAPSVLEWRLHAPEAMAVSGRDVVVTNRPAACRVQFLEPTDLRISQTDRFDVPPRPRIQLRQWHLTAMTPSNSPTAEFLVAIRPWRLGAPVPPPLASRRDGETWVVDADMPAGRLRLRFGSRQDPVAVDVESPDGTTRPVLRSSAVKVSDARTQ